MKTYSTILISVIFSLVLMETSMAAKITSMSPLPIGAVGQNYSYQLQARHDSVTGGNIYWQPQITSSNPSPLISGTWKNGTFSIPVPGLTLSSSGLISSTPSAAGDYSVVICAYDFAIDINDRGVYSDCQSFSLSVSPMPIPPKITSTSPLAAGTVGRNYYNQLQAVAGTGGNYSWVPEPNSQGWTGAGGNWNMPVPGVIMRGSGLLSGTPSVAGNYSFGICAKDSISQECKSFSLLIYPYPKITSTSPLPLGIVGDNYSFQLQYEGPPGSYWGPAAPKTWSRNSNGTWNMPVPGLTLSTAGLISGVPTKSGDFSFSIGRLSDGELGTTVITTAKFRVTNVIKMPHFPDEKISVPSPLENMKPKLPKISDPEK